MTEEEREIRAILLEVEVTKVMILRTKATLLINLIISISVFFLAFFVSYRLTELLGFGFLSGFFIGFGVIGLYFFVKNTLYFQTVFETEQGVKSIETRLHNCLKELQEKQNQ